METVSDEMKCYFKKLIEPLVINRSLEEPLNKLKVDIVEVFRKKPRIQIAKNGKLESNMQVNENTIDQLPVKHYDNEQYTKSSYLRIHEVNIKEQEREGYLMNMLDTLCPVRCQ